MSKKLLLVDYENKQKIDLSLLDDSYSAIIFVGSSQNPPKASRMKATAHRFTRVDFHKIEGDGKNALDFHIAFYLGRIFETAPQTECFVLSGDKGFDSLLAHLNKNGMKCKRLESMDELIPQPSNQNRSISVPGAAVSITACTRCKRDSTIEHYGGRWCTYCGSYSTPPDKAQLPRVPSGHQASFQHRAYSQPAVFKCGSCYQMVSMGDGIYDDGEWTCGGCLGL